MELNCKDSIVEFLERLARSGSKALKKGEPQFVPESLFVCLGMDEDLCSEFWRVLHKLRNELVPRHAEDNDLLNAFWDELVCEIDTDPGMYLDSPQTLTGLVNRFGDCWKKPLLEFEVMYSIDNMDVGAKPVTVLGVEFFTATKEALAEDIWGSERVEEWIENEMALAAVKVEAASSSTAYWVGTTQVDNALAVMRVSALAGRPAVVWLVDELVQWGRSGHSLVMSLSVEEPSLEWHWHRPYSAVVDDLSDAIGKGFEQLRARLFCDLPNDIRGRILRAVYWISRSTAHEEPAHKLVDLCTALEVLLVPDGQEQSSKGSLITLRYFLLTSTQETIIKHLYDRRNDVVHEGALSVVSATDVWRLRLVCYVTISCIAGRSANSPEMLTLRDLIDELETKESLERFIGLVDRKVLTAPLSNKIARAAKSRLKKMTTQSNGNQQTSDSG
ncbi:MAG: HEPN domain-containing protein [Chloroflexi bacterium]|nr:HEPN domain-containing protein [Chloroflexota bacterium]